MENNEIFRIIKRTIQRKSPRHPECADWIREVASRLKIGTGHDVVMVEKIVYGSLGVENIKVREERCNETKLLYYTVVSHS